MVPEHLQHLRRALDEPIALPEHAVAVEEPCVVLVQQVGVVFARIQSGSHGNNLDLWVLAQGDRSREAEVTE